MKTLTLSILLASFSFALSAEARDPRTSELTNPPVTQATCPVPLQQSAAPPGGSSLTICVAQESISSTTPEVVQLTESQDFATVLAYAEQTAAKRGKVIKPTDAYFLWAGVVKMVGINYSAKDLGAADDDYTPVGSISGVIKLDASGDVVLVTIESSIWAVPPSGASIGNQ